MLVGLDLKECIFVTLSYK